MTLKKMLLELQEKTINMLKEKLPAELCYHNWEHTLDVMQAAERIALSENASSEDIELVKTAAAYHDTGYIYSRENHEQMSCNIAREELLAVGVDEGTIENICELILATKVPHHPMNKLSEILCDADLDYLGRDDYFPIAQNVFKEFKNFGIVKDEKDWNELQVRFFQSHRYFTTTSVATRMKKKAEHLEMIQRQLAL